MSLRLKIKNNTALWLIDLAQFWKHNRNLTYGFLIF